MPASWVADEGLWDRAKEKVRSGGSYSEDSDAFWGTVVKVYHNMGGKKKGGGSINVKRSVKKAMQSSPIAEAYTANRYEVLFKASISGREESLEKAKKKKKKSSYYGPDKPGGKAPPLGSGERFKKLKDKISAKGDVEDPGAVAAKIGRKKFGKKRFQALAAAGK